MFRSWVFFISALAVLCAAAPALAGTCNPYSIDGSTTDVTDPINKERCKSANVEFSVTDGAANGKYRQYAGSGCETDIGDDDCKDLQKEVELDSAGNKKFSIKVEEALRVAGSSCDALNGDFILKLKPTASTGSGSDAGTGSGSIITCTLAIDTDVPPTPTDLKGGSGENSIGVSWDYNSDDIDEIEEFRVYYEVCPGETVLCTAMPSSCAGDSGGGAEDDGGAGAARDTTVNASDIKKALVDLNSESAGKSQKYHLDNKVEVGERAAVVVVAVDKAGNESEPSQVSCIEGVATMGFCDLMKQKGESCDDGCRVQAAGAETGRHAGLAALLIAPAVLVLARRRRK